MSVTFNGNYFYQELAEDLRCVLVVCDRKLGAVVSYVSTKFTWIV